MWVGLTLGAARAAAQNHVVETGGHVSILRLSEFESTDLGVGAHAVWPLTSVVAVDGAITWFGTTRASEGDPSHSRDTLGLLGLRASVGNGDIELFARGRVGVLQFGEQDSVVCIAVFPSPLGCRLATGYTALASDLGGGANIALGSSGRLRLHVEAGDLLVRYALQVFRPNGEISNGFVGHNPLVSFGLGWRF